LHKKTHLSSEQLQKPIVKIEEKGKINTPKTHMHEHSLSRLIKSSGAKVL
jgi:hypothetical protein